MSPILLVLGVGLIGGNRLGGRLADSGGVARALPAMLAPLCAGFFAMPQRATAVAITGASGLTAFATVPALQL
ncbi:hypothetical protein QFW77_07275 [Luteimonas sp. RD2P54]|uniref:MFS transporter n=1 Tax=Luteimonas endophytica TaxID=3042023 RepID=A0ABT6J7J1_9GAMM|nr:hypothetical protein [Luteimonas endophytica]MDH5822794.1 hypothetical protein [Luteimonas endophytica]